MKNIYLWGSAVVLISGACLCLPFLITKDHGPQFSDSTERINSEIEKGTVRMVCSNHDGKRRAMVIEKKNCFEVRTYEVVDEAGTLVQTATAEYRNVKLEDFDWVGAQFLPKTI